VPLLKFQMAPRLKVLMASGSKKGTQIYVSFLSISRQTNPFQVPQQGPYEEREARLQGILHISQNPHLSGSPVKEHSLKGPSWNPSQRGAPPVEPSFIRLLKSPV
jgi:hypothetical protein